MIADSLAILRRRPRPSWFRPVSLTAGIALAVVVGFLVGYRIVYADRIYPGITARGFDVGGLTRQEAHDLLTTRLRPLGETPLTLRSNNRQWQVPRSTLGAYYDVDQIVSAAYGIGRSGSIVSDAVSTPFLRAGTHDLSAALSVSSSDWNAVLDPIAATVDQPAIDARLTIGPNHAADVSADRDGSALDRAAAQNLILSTMLAESTAPIDLPLTILPPRVRASDLGSARQQATALLSGPLRVVYGDQTWSLDVDKIQVALILPGSPTASDPTTLQIAPSLLISFTDQIASDVDRPARDAVLALDRDHYVLRPSQSARRLVVDQTLARLNVSLFAVQRTVAPVVTESPPNVRDEDVQAGLAQANAIIRSDIDIRGPESHDWKLSQATLRQMIAVPDSPGLKAGQLPVLDPAKLTPFVAKIAKQLDHAPFNARFQRDAAGSVHLIRDASPGVTVSQGKSVSSIAAGAFTSQRTVDLVVDTNQPAVSAADADAIAVLGLLADNSTAYGFSIPPRRHNVELATSLLNGVVIGPGEIFSFNRELGGTSLERGFQIGYGIQAQGDAVKTVPSVAGGICQVATTLFQPVFWQGYTIEERYSHAYWIAHYISHGDVGLDTTVDEEAGLDFQFKNDTKSPILIQSATDGSSVHFAIYGVEPKWSVKVDPPIISKVVKTDPRPVVQLDPTLAKGRTINAEAAQDGFLVVVHRSVVDALGNARDLYLRSSYAPSHNVTLVGTKA